MVKTKKNILVVQNSKKNLKVLCDLLSTRDYTYNCINSLDKLKKFDFSSDLQLIIVSAQVKFISVSDFMNFFMEKFEPIPPVIYVDSLVEYDKKMLLECFRAGVSDYVKKPFDSFEVVARIESHINNFLKISECKLKIEKLASYASIDQLSKFSSKMHMQAILKHHVELFSRHENNFCVFYLRLLDTNKAIGAFGFEYGEKLIADFSKEMKKKLRKSDVVSRWIGPDFIILLPFTDKKSSVLVAKKLMAELNNIVLKPHIKPNVAIGITEVEDGDTVSSVLDKARSAMKEASQERYDKIQIFVKI